MDGRVLFCIGRGERGLSDRQRNLSDRDASAYAIAFFYAIGTGAGGIAGPLVFGDLIESAEAANVLIGYLIGAILMIAAGLIEAWIGVDAERKSLEDVARPLTEVGPHV